jgi:hypothetical protein
MTDPSRNVSSEHTGAHEANFDTSTANTSAPDTSTPDTSAQDTSTQDARALVEWSERLTQALQILDLQVDHARLLELAERSATEVVPSAGPVTTFLVGYAAGIASSSGEREVSAAVETATETAFAAVAHGVSEKAPASDGWSDTAQ